MTEVLHRSTLYALRYHHKMRDKITKSERADAAVAAIQRGESTNYSDAAVRLSPDAFAVSLRQRRRPTRSDISVLPSSKRRFLLIELIFLQTKQCPLTSHIVRNLAEEIRGGPVGIDDILLK